MSEGRVDISLMESPGVFIQELRDALSIDVLISDLVGINVASELVSDHGNLSGLADDDHLQYFNQARGMPGMKDPLAILRQMIIPFTPRLTAPAIGPHPQPGEVAPE